MPIVFGTATAPAGYVIGVAGDHGGHLRSIQATEPFRYLGPRDAFEIGDAATLFLDHTLALKDVFIRTQAAMELELFRRRGGTALLTSHEPELLLRLTDEIWWIEQGGIRAKGDPKETLERYQRHAAAEIAAQALGRQIVLPAALRKGDGRAQLESIETLDAEGRPTAVWQTGAPVAVRVTVRFAADVADPVIGILIRTRIGFEVFGTNTQLERIPLGPCAAGTRLAVTFRFPCHLCPHEYTLTAASHDPDGIWHDWVEDGIAFSVSDYRYTAGVACLRTEVALTPLG